MDEGSGDRGVPPHPDAFNFLCNLGFFEALVRKLTSL